MQKVSYLALTMAMATVFGARPFGTHLQAQDSVSLEFEVASIKEHTSPAGGGMAAITPGGGLTATHARATALIALAYQVRALDLAGAPDWARQVFYDVSARPGSAATPDQTRAMIRRLLADRFKLVVHRETRERDGYAVVQVKPGSPGLALKPSAIDCVKEFVPPCRQGAIGPGAFKMVGLPLRQLATSLEADIQAPVIDDTRMEGTFDVELKWSPDSSPNSDLPGVFTAIQEQLGLKLEPRRITREVLVIDRLEKPTPN